MRHTSARAGGTIPYPRHARSNWPSLATSILGGYVGRECIVYSDFVLETTKKVKNPLHRSALQFFERTNYSNAFTESGAGKSPQKVRTCTHARTTFEAKRQTRQHDSSACCAHHPKIGVILAPGCQPRISNRTSARKRLAVRTRCSFAAALDR